MTAEVHPSTAPPHTPRLLWLNSAHTLLAVSPTLTRRLFALPPAAAAAPVQVIAAHAAPRAVSAGRRPRRGSAAALRTGARGGSGRLAQDTFGEELRRAGYRAGRKRAAAAGRQSGHHAAAARIGPAGGLPGQSAPPGPLQQQRRRTLLLLLLLLLLLPLLPPPPLLLLLATDVLRSPLPPLARPRLGQRLPSPRRRRRCGRRRAVCGDSGIAGLRLCRRAGVGGGVGREGLEAEMQLWLVGAGAGAAQGLQRWYWRSSGNVGREGEGGDRQTDGR